MKTINIKLSKKLNELWLLNNIETEYWYYYTSDNWYMITETEYDWNKIVGQDYKTPLEAIENILEYLIKNNLITK